MEFNCRSQINVKSPEAKKRKGKNSKLKNTSYEMNWATALILPSIAYFDFEDQPATSSP